MSSPVRTSPTRSGSPAPAFALAALAALAPLVARSADSTSVAAPPAAASVPSSPARNATLPAASPDGKKVAYVSARDGVTDLYVVDVGTGMSTRLTNTPEAEGRPAWADEGKNIVFTVARGDTTLLLSVAAGGGMASTIAKLPGVRSIRLSNDGKRLAVTKGAWTRNRLGVTNRDGKLFRALTDSASAWWSPAWSPNDAVIAATRNDSTGAAQIVAVRSQSGRATELVRLPAGYGRPQCAAWSEDGKTLLFQAESPESEAAPGTNTHIYQLDIESLRISRLREHVQPMLDEMPCWLDEKQIVFQSSQSGAFELWIMRADGTLARQLTR